MKPDKSEDTRRGTLVLAWGNAGRIDDGLGPRLAEALETLELSDVTVLSEYQLQVEHAWEVARFRRVVFVDADRTAEAPFRMVPLLAESGPTRYTSHELPPAAVLALARDLYDARPEAWLMGIRGYEFDEFGEWLSSGASANLEAAVRFLVSRFRSFGDSAAPVTTSVTR